MNIRDIQLEWFGKAKSVKVKKDSTIIVDGADSQSAIKGRIESIGRQIEITTSSFDKENEGANRKMWRYRLEVIPRCVTTLKSTAIGGAYTIDNI